MKRTLLPKFMISIPSVLFWIAVALFDRTMQTATALTAAIFHELGHVAVIKLCGMHLTSLTVLPYGIEMTTDRLPCSFYEDIAVNAAGCAVNLTSAPLFHAFGSVIHGELGEFLLLLSTSSVALGILNAVPIISLDGGCVLESVLALLLPPQKVYGIVRAISFIFLILLWIFATYIFMFSGYNYSLFAMALWLFSRIFLSNG